MAVGSAVPLRLVLHQEGRLQNRRTGVHKFVLPLSWWTRRGHVWRPHLRDVYPRPPNILRTPKVNVIPFDLPSARKEERAVGMHPRGWVVAIILGQRVVQQRYPLRESSDHVINAAHTMSAWELDVQHCTETRRTLPSESASVECSKRK